MNTRFVAFDDIAALSPGDSVAYETPYGSCVGYVSEVVPGEYVSIFNGTGPWQITRQHLTEGLLTIPDEGSKP